MFPLFLQVFFFGFSAYCLVRDRRTHCYLFSTLFVTLTFGFSLLQLYALGIAADNAVVVSTIANVASLGEVMLSGMALAFVGLRAARLEMAAAEKN